MKKPTAVLTVVLAIFSSRGESSARDLASLIPGLYGGKGIFLAAPPAGSPFPSHAPHFSIDSAASINRLNEQITAQIGAFPFSSSVGGFTFAFEPALGTFVRTTETLGPLFAERAPTLGRGKLNLHFSSTFFTYDEFNGKSLDHLRVVARHQPDAIPPNDVRTSLELDTILININLDIHVRLFSLAATYGVTDRLDVGILVPVASVDMDVKSKAEIITSPENPFPRVHSFVGAPHGPTDAASDDADGIGDIVLRAKYLLLRSDVVDIAGEVLTKLETGDERNFLGTGKTTVRPFLIFSRTVSDVFAPYVNFLTPHLNLGYEFNVEDNHLSSVEYAAGLDAGTEKFTVAGDILGSHEPDGDSIGDHIVTASVGVKWNVFKRFLLFANLQFPLNHQGLRSDLIPTLGVEYSF